MLEKAKELIDSNIKEFNMWVDDVYFEKVEGKEILNIVIDSSEIMDLEKITKASRIINPIVDNNQITDRQYDELDIYAKEKGDVNNE